MARFIRDGKVTCVIEYSALPSQAKFHKSTARFKGFSGPIGSGKSRALCQEAIKLSYINAGRFGLIGAPTYPMLRDTTQAALLEILEENDLPYVLHKAENVLVMKDTGSRILFRSIDEYERLRGTNLAWFGVDELSYAKQEAWMRLEGRLRDPKGKRLCGFAVWTPKGHDWVYQRFLESTVEGYETVIAKPMENRHVLEKIPDFYERLKHSYDEKFYRQEVLGEYLSINDGLVYHAFQAGEHVEEIELTDSRPLYWALDFNVDPMCSVVAQRDGNVLRVLDEIVIRRASTTDACEEFRNRYGKHTAGVVVIGDASGRNSKTSGMSDYQMVRTYMERTGMAKVRLEFDRSNPPVRDRVALVNARLKSAAGDIGMRIS
ncbi:MAG: hypothetical protein GY953_28760, partial [bacterium]|nr:hypothetical protein [bacterium]